MELELELELDLVLRKWVVIHATLLCSAVLVIQASDQYSHHPFPFTSSSTSGRNNKSTYGDEEALLAFKGQITSDPLHALDTWNHSLSYCEWQGVTCGRRHGHRVVSLELNNLGLVGAVSPWIGNLSFLRTLSLQNNSFNGHIPTELSRLSRLTYLYLSNNSIGGEIPFNLSRCRRLVVISLGFNGLIGKIPAELGSLSKLRFFSLAKNNLTGTIPSSIGNLSSLTTLALRRNNLGSHVPHQLGQIQTLDVLVLGRNKLSGVIPSSLYNLSSLTVLELSLNQLHGSLPANFCHFLPNLVGLYMGGNQFDGSIPVSLPNCSRLMVIDMPLNRFSGAIPMDLGKIGSLVRLNLAKNMLGGGEGEVMSFFSSLTNCSLLWRLSLGYNQLTGALPNSISNLSTNLEWLVLGNNKLTGQIPSQIDNLFSLTWLALHSNSITGTIPKSIGNLSKLEVLYLFENKLSGEIPTSIGNLTRLYRFNIENNNLHGSIPLTIGSCRRLSSLNLAHNNLIGEIPKQIFDNPSLLFLRVEANSLTGAVPLDVGNLKNLNSLVVSNNKLSGEIPMSLDNCQSLEILSMATNSLWGPLPPLNSLKGLTELDVSHNNLSGQLPKYLKDFVYLQYLNISFNNFEGKVPRGRVFENTSTISIIGNHGLCGGSPKLKLPPCKIKTNEQRDRKSSRVKMVAFVSISVLFFILLSSIVFILHFLRTKEKKHSTSALVPLENQFLIVSYMDLSNATAGFSPLNLIGKGSNSLVYKGILNQNNMVVAIKVFNLQQRGAHKNFVAECKSLRNIRHRNLLRVLNVCSGIDREGCDFKAIVFEYMENGNLEQWLYPNANEQCENRNLTLRQRLNIAVDVASALDYLHNHCERPIVHCDLKPSNVLLNDEMVACLGDFGLTKWLVCNSDSHYASSCVRGTIGYVAPEYGLGAEVSTYGDVFSFGILLLELFIGKKPSDAVFHQSLNLHEFAKLALPNHVMEIIDPRLLSEEVEGQMHAPLKKRLERSLASIIKIGVACSLAIVQNRMAIREVLREMQVIRDSFNGVELCE